MEVVLFEMTKGRDSDSRAAALFQRHARPMAPPTEWESLIGSGLAGTFWFGRFRGYHIF
jgi:hypothetical protein